MYLDLVQCTTENQFKYFKYLITFFTNKNKHKKNQTWRSKNVLTIFEILCKIKMHNNSATKIGNFF